MALKQSRRQARRKAFELLFELEQHPGLTAEASLARAFGDPDVLDAYRRDDDDDGYVVIPARNSEEGGLRLAGAAQGLATFTTELVRAVKRHEQAIDAELEKHPEDWTFDRIGTAERCLLRLAVAEMVYLGTSYKVVIDEILDIAKMYAQEDATRFINGILGAVVRNLPALRESAVSGGHASTPDSQPESSA